ncbi:MAG: hypothetical protein IPJ31_11195, partial [Bacteroidetes bacterium]|nr:hypothetical protein [Bacteroidota bacterium]
LTTIINTCTTNKNNYVYALNELRTLKEEFEIKQQELSNYKLSKKYLTDKYTIDLDKLFSFTVDTKEIDSKIIELDVLLNDVKFDLGELEVEGKISKAQEYKTISERWLSFIQNLKGLNLLIRII